MPDEYKPQKSGYITDFHDIGGAHPVTVGFTPLYESKIDRRGPHPVVDMK
ncbi:MAG: hypothetical protein ABIG84_01585 [archaeon]